ncbi:MAG: EamA family transporter [Clostridiales bacterium]|jgi:transporter family protein|nr:EamA family transporter [Clostridiales bacterium]
MWVAFALGSAFFAAITSILAKMGVKNINANLATAIRTVVVLLFAWLMVFVTGAYHTLRLIAFDNILFLVLSGLSTGGSWICYFKALQTGDINKVVPIDKFSVVLTMLLAFIFLGERVSWTGVAAMALIAAGTYLMIAFKKTDKNVIGKQWLIYALLSALFASLQAILGKVGVAAMDSNLATAIRTIVVLVMAWVIVLTQGKQKEIKNIDKKSGVFLVLSGLSTGLSWLCYYRALQDGPASVVVPIDKLSILAAVALSFVIFKERLTKKSAGGLALIVAGTLCLLLHR